MMAEASEKSTEKPEGRPGALELEKPQPHNLEAERSVLSAMLRDPENCVDEAIEYLGENPEMFYSHIHREIFNAILELKSGGEMAVDLLTVAHVLTRRGTLDRVGGEVFLAELYGEIATGANLESWCKMLRDSFCLRKMITVCTKSVLNAYDADKAPSEIIEEIEKSVFEVRHAVERSQMVDLKTAMYSEFQRIMDLVNKKIKSGILTGFPKLDSLTGGLKPGEMFVLAARPSIGKTALALNIIRNITLKEDGPSSVLFFSLEMGAGQITRRMICTESEIPESAFTDGSFNDSDMPRLTKACGKIEKAQLYIDPTPGLSIGSLQARARRAKARYNIDLVVIDYLQLMNAGGRSESRQNEVAEISRGIKQLAKDLSIPVLVLAQLNRDIEKSTEPNPLPKLSHLRESGAIEQDADVVTFLHRDRDQTKNLTAEKAANGVPALLIVEKNRNGQTGMVNLKFFPRKMQFVCQSHFTEDDHPPAE